MKKTTIGRTHRPLYYYLGVAALVLSLAGLTSPALAQDDGVIIKGEKGSEATDVREGQERYGPITSSDTLWAIASEYRPHSRVTQYQTMIAIAQANPRAFVDGNTNRMLDGFYLRIPSLQEIQMINPETARRRVLADEQLASQQQRLSQAQQQTETTREQQQQLLNEARSRAEQVIEQVEQQQQQSFSQLQGEVNESMQALQRVYDENEQIQQRLDALAERIEELSSGLQQTGELEQQFDQLLQQQQQLMEMQQQQQQQEQSSDLLEWLKEPLNLVLLATIPALLIAVALYLLFVRRSSNTDEKDTAQAKKPAELDDEEAAKALDRELMEGGQDSADDGLFDLDGDFNQDEDDLGDDLSALEAELTQTGQADDEDDFSIRLDDEESDDGSLIDDELDETDSSLLPDEESNETAEDNEPQAITEDTSEAEQANTQSSGDDAEDDNSELSQEELDQLFAESDDNEPALDLSLDDEDEQTESDSDDAAESESDSETVPEPESEPEPEPESKAEPEPEPEPEAELESESEPEPESEPESEPGPEPEPEADTDTPASTEDDATNEFEDPDEADEALAQLGIEAGDEDDDGDIYDEQDLDSLLRESEELEAELDDLETLEEQLPEDDEALEEAEQQADSDLDDFFGETSTSEPEQTGADQAQPQDNDEEQQPATTDDGYVDIDTLMADADNDDNEDKDNYPSSAVEDLLNDESLEEFSQTQAEADSTDEEAAAQLDLARAYIDMGEEDEAKDILQQLIDSEDESLAKDAKQLLSKINA